MKKSAGFKKIPPGGGKNISDWVVRQHAKSKKKPHGFFLAPGAFPARGGAGGGGRWWWWRWRRRDGGDGGDGGGGGDGGDGGRS